MKKTTNIEVKVGIVTVVGIALFIIGLTLGKGVNVNTGKPEISFIFPNSGGIENGAPVLVNGVERGKVYKVANSNDAVEIKAVIDRTDDLFADPTAIISILEITGGKKIEILPGKSGQFDISRPIQGQTPPDIADLVRILGNVSGDAVNLVKRLDTALIAANILLTDEDFIADIKTTVAEASIAAQNLNKLLDDNSNKITSAVNNLEYLSKQLVYSVDKNEPKVSNIISELDIAIVDAKKVLNNANLVLLDFNKVAQDIKELTNAIKNDSGLINKLIYDESLSKQLDSTFIKLDELLNIIHEHGVNVNLRLGTRP